jgi:hypothetical protein
VLGAVVTTVTGFFDRRFLRNAFALSAVFLIACGAAVLAGRRDLSGALDAWTTLSVGGQLLAIVAFFAAVWFLAAIVDSQTRTITKLYEGYWTGPLTPLRRHGERRHRARHALLIQEDRAGSLYTDYPVSAKQLMATRLGNILRASERYPLDRYGATSIFVWPRLYALLPDREVTLVAQARASLEFLLVLSALATAFGLLAAGYLLAVTAPVWLFLLCAWGGLGIAAVAYRASLSAAVVYADVVRTAFDLHRLDVLTGMQFPRPTDAAAERRAWEHLVQLVVRNQPPAGPYPPPPPHTGD